MEQQKKKRVPWTEERKAKLRESKLRKSAENLEKFGTRLTPEGLASRRASLQQTNTERRNNSKARAYLPELQHWVLSLLQAMNNPELFDALVEAHPERKIQWDRHRQHILFSFSTNTLRPRYGILAEQMFRRLFSCYQPGGFSTETKAGYSSVWRLNQEALNVWLIASQRKKFSVAEAFKVLMTVVQEVRAASDYEITEDEGTGLQQLKGVNKKMMTVHERKEILKDRREKHAQVVKHNEEIMADWTSKKKKAA